MGRTVAAGIAALGALTLLAGPAAADPTYPSQDQVDRARQQQAAAAGDVGRIQAQYAAAQARADDADTALSVAAEDYDEAVIELADSRTVADAAQAAAARAVARVAAAQKDVGRLASEAYRGGGGLSSLEVVLSDQGPQDVLDRASMLRTVGDRRQHTVQKLDAARVVANVMQRQAADAVARNRAAERRLDSARQAAQARAAAARTIAARTAAEQEQLLARLAAAQRTTVALERQRQQGLAEAAAERDRQRREAQARQQAAAQAARDRARRPGSSGSRPAAPSVPNMAGGSSSGSRSGGQAAVGWARRQVGLPYLWGGAGPDSYDCSGLTMRAWQRAGVSLPHSSRLQYRLARKVPLPGMRPGDLIFYATDTSNPSSIHHVTMYAGNGLMVEAPATGLDVRVVPVRTRGRMPYAARP